MNNEQLTIKYKPQRMCVACRKREEKSSLIRVGEGRGAYVHDSSDCIVNAIKRRGLVRALKGKCEMNILTTLGLCKRAGKIITGFDAVIADIKKSSGILIASDLSVKTKKEVAFHCDKHDKKLIEIDHTMDEIAGVLNKKTGVISIMDKGLFSSLTK
jgi:predicted RNA-binding protein YlxR (DUF448 family)